MTIGESEPNFYSGAYVERMSQLRRDADWLKQALEDTNTLIVPLWRAHSLIARDADITRAVLVESEAQLLAQINPSELILLGKFRERTCFAYEFKHPEQFKVPLATEFEELRTVADLLDPDEAGLLAYARAMVLWRERHRFCGRCGSPTESIRAGHVLKCTNVDCALEQFPRLDPAIIVLVSAGDRALLGRQASWPTGRYSTIAGYVEPGESLEDAVRREVREETGIETDNVRYHSSQPWPFPASIMLGFLAHATTTLIERGDNELEDAQWFTRAAIANGDIALPAPQSISLRLIETWYNQDAPRQLRAEPRAKISSWARR